MSTFIPLTVHDVHWGPTLDYALQPPAVTRPVRGRTLGRGGPGPRTGAMLSTLHALPDVEAYGVSLSRRREARGIADSSHGTTGAAGQSGGQAALSALNFAIGSSSARLALSLASL